MNRLYRLIERYELIDAARTVRHPIRAVDRTRARRWAAERARPFSDVMQRIDADVWSEARAWEDAYRPEADRRLAGLEELRLGAGPGLAAPVYALTRLLRPDAVVETGVGAGWTTAAILSALHVNGHGHLWSSELPHQRPWVIDDYTPFVGAIVEESLRDRWTVLLDGDRDNLPRILDECGPVGLFCYDSDKTYEGREFALSLVEPHLTDDAVVVIDDVGDNLQFRDWCEDHEGVVLRRPGAFVGTVGLPIERRS